MPKEWSPELSIVSDTNTCSIPADRRDAVVQNSAVSRVFGRMFAYDVPAPFAAIFAGVRAANRTVISPNTMLTPMLSQLMPKIGI